MFHVIPVCPNGPEVLPRKVTVICLQIILKMLTGMFESTSRERIRLETHVERL
jgi:hypothetical protein